MIIYIYKQTKLIARPQAETFEEFKANPNAFYPSWTNDLIASEIEFRYPKLVNGFLTEKTQEELKLEGILELVDGEKIVDGKLIVIEKPNGLKIEWTGSEWIESATQEEIEEHEFNESVAFYNSELEFASKATAELACEIITEDMFLSVKEYMKAIDPYGQPMRTFSVPRRPSIFDKYK